MSSLQVSLLKYPIYRDYNFKLIGLLESLYDDFNFASIDQDWNLKLYKNLNQKRASANFELKLGYIKSLDIPKDPAFSSRFILVNFDSFILLQKTGKGTKNVYENRIKKDLPDYAILTIKDKDFPPLKEMRKWKDK